MRQLRRQAQTGTPVIAVTVIGDLVPALRLDRRRLPRVSNAVVDLYSSDAPSIAEVHCSRPVTECPVKIAVRELVNGWRTHS